MTPFAARALDRGLTGAMVSMIRLTNEPFNPNTGASEMKSTSEKPAEIAIGVMATRANNMYGSSKESTTKEMAARRIDKWTKEAKEPGRRLGYKSVRNSGDIVNLIEKPGGKPWGLMTVPQSMREVEAGVRLIMDSERRTADEPDWEPPQKVHAGESATEEAN